MSDLVGATWSPGALDASHLVSLGAVAIGCTPATPPLAVHQAVIDAMGFHPMIYMGESMVTWPSNDAEIYYLRGDDRLCAEAEAWLRRLLTRQRAPLLPSIARAFATGHSPIVLDFEPETLVFKIGGRNNNRPGHVHYVRSSELWLGDVQLRTKGRQLLGVLHGGEEFPGEDVDDPGRRRAFAAVWDPKPGAAVEDFWRGQGSRFRAYKDWIEEGAARLWEIRALERGVDLPRVGYAPSGKLSIGGREVSAIRLLKEQITALRSGSTIVLPNTLLADNTPAFKVQVLEQTMQHQLVAYAIDSRSARMMRASLNPTNLDKATEEQFMDTAQKVCDFVAATLTRIVNAVVELHHGKGHFVQVLANDIPKRRLRVALEVFRAVVSHTQHLPDGKTVQIGELVDGPEILKQIGIMGRPLDEAAHKQVAPPPAGPPGRPIDTTSSREERRDDARTVEGEEDTGGEDVEREERA